MSEITETRREAYFVLASTIEVATVDQGLFTVTRGKYSTWASGAGPRTESVMLFGHRRRKDGTLGQREQVLWFPEKHPELWSTIDRVVAQARTQLGVAPSELDLRYDRRRPAAPRD